eukprot:GHVH01015392.1.p1 GENE.GHVH01015392.1~~GHVH01015392.1.p1  ORF type:complete len:124 (+),score=16.68 GHVH01015392.1:252-623(+)
MMSTDTTKPKTVDSDSPVSVDIIYSKLFDRRPISSWELTLRSGKLGLTNQETMSLIDDLRIEYARIPLQHRSAVAYLLMSDDPSHLRIVIGCFAECSYDKCHQAFIRFIKDQSPHYCDSGSTS